MHKISGYRFIREQQTVSNHYRTLQEALDAAEEEASADESGIEYEIVAVIRDGTICQSLVWEDEE